MEENATASPSTSAGTNPGLIVLQWLTCALWGWTVLGTSILVGAVFANLVAHARTGGFTPYGTAAVLVLLPLSVVCDVLYRRHETPKKSGAASIVMVIHAVIFALFAVGSLIAAVFALITMFTNDGGSDVAMTSLWTALVVFVLYCVTFLRTVHPPRMPQVARFYPIFMAVVVGIIAIAGLVGPMAEAHRTKSDRLIENNLTSIETSIDSYAQSKDRLPDSLSSLSLQGDDAKLAPLLEYTPNTLAVSADLNTGVTTFYYKLCATYKAKGDGTAQNSQEYSSYADTYNHPSGYVCYKLTATSTSS